MRRAHSLPVALRRPDRPQIEESIHRKEANRLRKNEDAVLQGCLFIEDSGFGKPSPPNRQCAGTKIGPVNIGQPLKCYTCKYKGFSKGCPVLDIVTAMGHADYGGGGGIRLTFIDVFQTLGVT